ncbi:hypothetical protein JCM1841_003259 [Sporobolomyces salmonicolor]
MLSASLRPAAARACFACRTCSRRLASSLGSPPAAFSTCAPPTATRPRATQSIPFVPARGAATRAQSSDAVQEHLQQDGAKDDQHEGELHPAEEEGNIPADDVAALEANRTAHEPAAPGPSSAPSTSPPSSSSSPTTAPPDQPAVIDPVPPPPQKSPLETLLAKSAVPGGGPTLDDLFALRPRRFTIPSAVAPDSHRTIYRKAWEVAYARIDRAFNKRQLQFFCGPRALDLDLTDPDNKLRHGTTGKKHKWWKPKRIDQMSKRELIQTILILEFGMVDPETVPNPNKGPRVIEAVPLSDRTLFLILSPSSPVIPKLARQLGIELSFRRDSKTQVLSLVLRGSALMVAAAKAELEAVDETCKRREFELPKPATTLRPEVYQAVSRVAKAYLEPGSVPNVLVASSVEANSLHKTERLLASAFARDSEQSSTALFASLPTNLETLRYSFFPHKPLHAPSPLSSGATPHFARLKSLSLSPSPVTGELDADAATAEGDAEHQAQLELLAWSERMRLERTSRVALRLPAGGVGGQLVKSSSSILAALRAPFKADEAEGATVEIRARFGHVVWPLYREGDQGLGPVLPGKWGFETFARWVDKMEGKVKNVFVPSPPNGFLHSTGILTPLPSTSASFASLLSPLPSVSSDELASQQLSTVLSAPSLVSTEVRRLVYRPMNLPKNGEVERKLEVEFEMSSPEGERTREVVASRVSEVRENLVEVMVPTGVEDAQFSMVIKKEVESHERPKALTADALSTGRPALTLTHASEIYFLDTNDLVRRTVITPPVPSSSSSSAAPPFTQVQEAYHSRGDDSTRAIDVALVLGHGTVEGIRETGAWKHGLEEVERRCADRTGAGAGAGVGRGAKKGLGGR